MRIFLVAILVIFLSSCADLPSFVEVARVVIGDEILPEEKGPEPVRHAEKLCRPGDAQADPDCAAEMDNAFHPVVVIELGPLPVVDFDTYLADRAEPKGREIPAARFVDPGYLTDGFQSVRRYLAKLFGPSEQVASTQG